MASVLRAPRARLVFVFPALVTTAQLLLMVVVAFSSGGVHAFPTLRSLIPNGFRVLRLGQQWPAVGHVDRLGGPAGLNAFGAAFRDNLYEWTPAFCRNDTDGDGYSNGAELGDPNCVFAVGDAVDRFFDAWSTISHPGFNDSTPAAEAATNTGAFGQFIVGANFTVAFEPSDSTGSFWAWRNTSLHQACRYATGARLACDLGFDWMPVATSIAASTTPTLTTTTTTTTVAANTTGAVPSSTPAATTANNGTSSPAAPAAATTTAAAAMAATAARRSNLLGATLVMSAWVFGLEDVDLSHQRLVGILDLAAISGLPIRRAILRNNSLTGPFEASLLPATLEELDLAGNQLTGALNLTNVTLPAGLRLLDLSGNAFSSITLGNFRGGSSALQIRVASAGTSGGGLPTTAVGYTCGSQHGAFTFVNSSGAAEVVPADAVPVSCVGCVPGLLYDISQSPCAALSALVTTAPQFATAAVNVRYTNDIANYCDAGCTAVFVMLLIFLVAIVIFIVVFKFLVAIEDDASARRSTTTTKTVTKQETTSAAAGSEATTTTTTSSCATRTTTTAVVDERSSAQA
jgi:hypothetical protein